jgi:hypothetical protein
LDEHIVHIHLRVRRWVLWWLGLGVIAGAVALLNMLARNLTRSQDQLILIIGILHWVLGGIVCWAFEGIRVQNPAPPSHNELTPFQKPAATAREKEWYPASALLIPGGRKRLLPLRLWRSGRSRSWRSERA